MSVTVTVNLGKLPGMAKTLRSMSTGSPDERAKRLYKLWTHRVEGFTRTRFARLSRGGGEWPPLALSTVRGRRPADKRNKGKAPKGLTQARDTRRGGGLVDSGRSYAILRNTGVLFNSLTLNSPGNKVTPIPGGVRYGYSTARHSKTSKGVTIAKLAVWHQTGAGRLPVRRIFVKPDKATTSAMAADAVAVFGAPV